MINFLDFKYFKRYTPNPKGEKGGMHMSQPENSKINVEKTREYLHDAISLLIMLENDLSTQDSDEIHLRAVRVTHEILRKVDKELS